MESLEFSLYSVFFSISWLVLCQVMYGRNFVIAPVVISCRRAVNSGSSGHLTSER